MKTYSTFLHDIETETINNPLTIRISVRISGTKATEEVLRRLASGIDKVFNAETRRNARKK